MNNANIRLFYGPNQFLLQRELKRWKVGFMAKHGEANLEILDGKNVSGSDIINAADTSPFLGEKRLMIVTDFLPEPRARDHRETSKSTNKQAQDNGRELLIEYLPRLPETTILLLVSRNPDKRSRLFKALEKQGMIHCFEELKGTAFAQWLNNELEIAGILLDRMARERLIALLGDDMWKASQEIEKLVLLNKKDITSDDLDTVVASNAQANIFAFVDALGKKNLQDAMRSFDRLLAMGENIFVIFSMIVRQFRLILMASSLMRQGESTRTMLSRLKIAPFQLSPLLKQAENFTESELIGIYQKLLQIDLEFKTGKIALPSENSELARLRLEQFFVETISFK